MDRANRRARVAVDILLLRFDPVRLSFAVQLKPRSVLFLLRFRREIDGLLLPFGGLVEHCGFSVGGSQGVEDLKIIPLSQFAGLIGILECFLRVPKLLFPASCADPCTAVERRGRLRI